MADNIYTVGSTNATKVTLEESYALNIGHVAAEALVIGQVVQLKNDGEVTSLTAVTDKPYGVVTKGGALGERVTIASQFIAVLTGIADGTVAIADEVSVSEFSVTADKYKKSVATNWVSGIAIVGGADTETVSIGILRTPYLKA